MTKIKIDLPLILAKLPTIPLQKSACHRCSERFCVFFRSQSRILVPRARTVWNKKGTNYKVNVWSNSFIWLIESHNNTDNWIRMHFESRVTPNWEYFFRKMFINAPWPGLVSYLHKFPVHSNEWIRMIVQRSNEWSVCKCGYGTTRHIYLHFYIIRLKYTFGLLRKNNYRQSCFFCFFFIVYDNNGR